MKKEKWLAECREKNAEALNQQLKDLLRKQFKLKLQKSSGELTNKSVLLDVRRDIARLHTLLSEMKHREKVA